MSKQAKKGLVPKLRFPEFRGAGNWKLKPFSKLFEIGSGKDYKHLSSGEIPVYGSGGYMLSVNDYLYDGESACIGRKGTINNPIFLTGKFWTVDTLFYTHSFKECLSKFIFLHFQNINWLQYNEAGGVPSLSKVIINKIEVAVPAKIEEQQKIADCLTSIDELIALQTQKLDALKNHKKGLMQQLFPAEGETLPKLRFPEFRDNWDEEQLGKLGEFTGGGTPSKSNDSYWKGDIPWVSSSDIDEESIHEINISRFITEEALCNSATKQVPENSILLVSRVGVGKLAISKKPVCTSQDFTSFTPSKDNLLFLGYFLKSRNKVLLEYSQGMAIKGFTKEDISKLEVVFPSPEEQQKIADCLTSIDELITFQTQKVETLKSHKKGLMQQLFPAMEEI